MPWWISQLFSAGTKKHSHLTADSDKELERMAKKLHVPVRGGSFSGKGKDAHLDLNEHKRKLALRYGAREREE